MIALIIVANVFAAKPTDVADVPTPSPSPSTVSSLPIFVQETPKPPTATPGLTPTPTPLPPTASPTPSPTPTPSPSPSPMPTPTRTLAPTLAPTAAPTLVPTPPATLPPMPATPPPTGLVIIEPVDGSTTSSSSVVIEGFAQPGVTITHDIPNWFDEHTTADSQGRWMFTENLAQGQNTFKFRVADDMTTEVTVTVYYEPV